MNNKLIHSNQVIKGLPFNIKNYKILRYDLIELFCTDTENNFSLIFSTDYLQDFIDKVENYINSEEKLTIKNIEDWEVD